MEGGGGEGRRGGAEGGRGGEEKEEEKEEEGRIRKRMASWVLKIELESTETSLYLTFISQEFKII